MEIFRNFFFALILMGICTRVSNYFYLKNFKRSIAAYLSLVTAAIPLIFIMSFVIGFDVAVSEYLIAGLLWLIYDLLRSAVVKYKEKNK